MSTSFKLKAGKNNHKSDVHTLDDAHTKIEANFRKRTRSLPSKKAKLKILVKKLNDIENKDAKSYTNKDIQSRSNLKTSIEELEEEIYDIENNVSEIEYYSKVSCILMDYYDILDDNYIPEICEEVVNDGNNDEIDDSELEDELFSYYCNDISSEEYDFSNLDTINKMRGINEKDNNKSSRVNRKKKKKYNDKIIDNDITLYFKQSGSNNDNNGINNEIKETINSTDRSELLNTFRMLIDDEYIYYNCDKIKKYQTCESCSTDKTLIHNEGIYVCQNCGDVDMIAIDCDKSSHKDSASDKQCGGYPYKRINHYSEYVIFCILYTITVLNSRLLNTCSMVIGENSGDTTANLQRITYLCY